MKRNFNPSQVAKLVGASPCTPEGCGFHIQLRHVPKLRVYFLGRVPTEGSEVTDQCFSLTSMFLSPPSLPPLLSALFKVNKKAYLWVRIKNTYIIKQISDSKPKRTWNNFWLIT